MLMYRSEEYTAQKNLAKGNKLKEYGKTKTAGFVNRCYFSSSLLI